MAHTLSSNGFSHDMQVVDVLDYLRIEHADEYTAIRKFFPETIIMDGASMATEAMHVDIEWSSWLTDRIEEGGLVTWWEGEPWAIIDGEPNPWDDDDEFYSTTDVNPGGVPEVVS